jgi:uncharacterized protein (TIGR02679 family)
MTDPETLPVRTSAPIPEQVLRWARRPGAASLLLAVRGKVEAGKSGDRVQVAVPEGHRDDVGRMLGVAWDLSSKPVTLRLLRDALARDGVDLSALLTEVGGPLRDRRAERRQAADAKDQLRAEAADLLIDAGVPRLIAKVAVTRRWLGPEPRAVARVAAAAWSALPSIPGGSSPNAEIVGLAEFAGQGLLDPHALDRDQPAGRAVARLLAATVTYLDHPAGPQSRVETGAETAQAVAAPAVEAAVKAAASVLRARAWRTTWARAGISCDQVSSTALVLNLPLEGANPALERLTAVRGEPLWVTQRMTAGGCSTPAGWGMTGAATRRIVRVCENPSVMEAAANRLGGACPPLVCVYGRPTSAAWDVLDAIAAGGALLLISTDRDKAGEQIAADLSATIAGRYGRDRIASWLPVAAGQFEEERIELLLDDLGNAT